jgi:cob(I)alamin adenosyltransferase
LRGAARPPAAPPPTADILTHLQRDLFAVGAVLADPNRRIAARVTKATIGDADVRRLERWIDELEEELPPLRHFILAGGNMAGAQLHLARAVCRRAERLVVSLGPDAVSPDTMAYVNRLSDLLFVLARIVNHRAGVPEQEW